jgi:ribonuclease J
MSSTLRIIPLGGSGEIGKNMLLFEYNNHGIVVDAGLMFPEGDHLGVDYIIPDFGYITNNRNRLTIHGLFITHGHEDHIGAIKHVAEALEAPIFATPLTMGLIKNKLRDLKKTPKMNIIRAGDTIKRGPFEVEAFRVTHSIPDCLGFGIRTPAGLVVHTGDFKFDHTPVDGQPTDFATLARFGQEGTLVLLSDSTNADRPGWTPSEAVIDEAFDKVFINATGRIMVATFASLISRVAQVAKAAQTYRRKMAVVGTSMNENIRLAFELQYLDFPRDLIVPIEVALNMPPEKVVFLVTGSQGEPTAVLSKLAHGKHPQLEVMEGDTFILSAHPIPGNEELVQRTINRLFQKGANVVYDAIEKVHVSGHASQEEMKMMLGLVKPRYFIPVHGELRHLHSHVRLAQQMGVPYENCAVVENGTIIEFDKRGMHIKDRYPGGYIFVDGYGVGDIGPAVMRDREMLAAEGFVAIFAVTDSQGKLLKPPHILSRGFVFLRESDEMFASIKEIVQRDIKKSANGRRESAIEESISRMIFQETKRRPMVFVHISSVNH